MECPDSNESGGPTIVKSQRVTINEVANRAGVSRTAVSYAMNGKPGVSEETRKQVLEVAVSMGWKPNESARALRDYSSRSIGLILNRNAKLLSIEPYYTEFISGTQEVLARNGLSLLFRVVQSLDEECEVLREWAESHKVDGVLVVDFFNDDPRPSLLKELDLPAVFAGQPAEPVVADLGARGDRRTQVWADPIEGATELIEYLAALGHTQIARVAGLSKYTHTQYRTEVLGELVARMGLEPIRTVEADFEAEGAARATRLLLGGKSRPTAIIYDNDVMAVTGLSVAQEMGFSVPDDFSIVAWDDSMLCSITYPTLTAMDFDIPAFAASATESLIELAQGRDVPIVHLTNAQLIVRGSTGPRKTE